MAVTYGNIVVDSKSSAWLNSRYYRDNCSVDFVTQAMGRKYQRAFANYLHNVISERYADSNTVKILELGARGIYFENGVAEELLLLDSEHGTEYAKNIEYNLLDISRVAMDFAREEYEGLSNHTIFNTHFYVQDATKSLPKGFDIIVMNELLDDLPHAVVTKKNNNLYEVLYKISMCDDINTFIGLKRHGLMQIKDNQLCDSEILKKVEEGYATTYSIYIPKVIANASASLNKQGMLFIHDYGIMSNVHAGSAKGLRRIYGMDMPSIIYQRITSPVKVQITTDVNWKQVLSSLHANGFSVDMMEHHDAFVNDMLGKKVISICDIACTLNSMSNIEKKQLLSKLNNAPIEKKNINTGLADSINGLLRNRVLEFKNAFRGLSEGEVDLNYKIESDERREALYNAYKRNCCSNLFIDIAAAKMQSR
jgi:SAM-dependent MidA family methyltransferase